MNGGINVCIYEYIYIALEMLMKMKSCVDKRYMCCVEGVGVHRL